MGQQPMIIQGGMGVAISNWRLARAVSQRGGLGVVSGTGVASVVARRLQLGDLDGAVRRALAAFPVPELAVRVLEDYFIEGGKHPSQPFKLVPLHTLRSSQRLLELTVVANFVEVYLAKDGHGGLVGINLLEKVLLPNLASLYGALLADVDYVLMGAGIPREIPGALGALARHERTSLRVPVAGDAAEVEERVWFDPQAVLGVALPPLRRPQFLPIVSSAVLAATLAKKATGRVDGFIIEGPSAGGHNAPPRGPAVHNERGEPIYGPRDEVDLEKFRALGLPFWLAGSYGSPERLRAALDAGASGVQLGTLFALCSDSGLDEQLRRRMLEAVRAGGLDVLTSALASPTGFPFKVALLPGTIAAPVTYAARPRLCDLGYLRSAYRREDGAVGFRCPAEPVEDYLRKGGALEETVDRACLCNGLMATAGFGQHRASGYDEAPLLTIGDDVHAALQLLASDGAAYSAEDVIAYLEQALVAA